MLLLGHRIVFTSHLATIASENTTQDGGRGYQYFNDLTFALARYDRARNRERRPNTTTVSYCLSAGCSFGVENKLVAF